LARFHLSLLPAERQVDRMKLVEETRTRLTFQVELEKVMLGAPDPLQIILAFVGILSYLVLLENRPVFNLENIGVILPYVLIGNLCLFMAWLCTGNKMRSNSYIFDLESGKITNKTDYKWRSHKSEYFLEEFQCIQIQVEYEGRWNNLMLKSKSGWTVRFGFSRTSYEDNSKELNTAKIISEFLNIPICESEA
jgi:hypothetical protein